MRILTIAAHPDDETLGVGGTMARLSADSHETHVCVLTEGGTARHRHVELQQECAIRTCGVLGVSDVMFCGLPDQRLDALPLLDVTPIEKCIGEFRPHLVFTHFKEDPNQDHRVAFAATLVATRPLADSEMRPYPHPRSYRELEAYSRRYGAISGLAAAESFMLVRHVQWMRVNSHVLGT